MDKFEFLEKKIKQAAGQIDQLKEERDMLQSELKFLETENKKVKELIEEKHGWTEHKRLITSKVERLLKKINAIKV